MNDLHIMTSTKGGVGKTLVSICSLLHYYQKSAPVVGIDLNTMNPDFFRILSLTQSRPLPRMDWEKAELGGNGAVIVRPTKPRSLPDGAIGFWRRIDQISDYPDFSSSTVIIDTNLHVANFVQSDEAKSPLHVIEQLLSKARRIYFWVIWSWASFQEIQPIYAAFDTLSHRFGDAVSIVHVLNPSAIVPPQTELVTRTQMILAVNEAITGLKKLASYLGEEDSAQLLIKAIHTMSPEKRSKTNNSDDYSVSGLLELSKAEPTKPLSLTAFRLVTEEILRHLRENSPSDLSLFVPVNQAIQRLVANIPFDTTSATSFEIPIERMKRPSNVLAIGSHDARLAGYTDKFARSPANNIQRIVLEISPSIRETVSNFLTYLQPVLPIDEVSSSRK